MQIRKGVAIVLPVLWLMNLILMIWVWCITGLGHGHEGSLYPHEQEGGLQLASSDKWRIVYHQQRLQSRVSPSRFSLWHLLFYQKIRSGIKFTSKFTFGILLVIFLLTNHRFLHSFINQKTWTRKVECRLYGYFLYCCFWVLKCWNIVMMN